MACSSFGASTGAGSRTGKRLFTECYRLNVFVYVHILKQKRAADQTSTGRRRAGLSAGTGVLST